MYPSPSNLSFNVCSVYLSSILYAVLELSNCEDILNPKSCNPLPLVLVIDILSNINPSPFESTFTFIYVVSPSCVIF